MIFKKIFVYFVSTILAVTVLIGLVIFYFLDTSPTLKDYRSIKKASVIRCYLIIIVIIKAISKSMLVITKPLLVLL